jgi:hypothetical protein
MTFAGREMSTIDLAAWCYPRLQGKPQRGHRHAIRRAALRVAEPIRRDGRTVIWRARDI